MSGHTNNGGFPPNVSLVNHLSHAGLLPSHVYFGSCFFVLGAWWLTAVLRDQHRRDRKTEPRLSFAGKCGPCSGKMIEGLVKLVACIVGCVIEVITVKVLGRAENYTYEAIYASFMVAALVDIFQGLRFVLPEGIDYLAHAIAFANLAILARSQSSGHLHLTVSTRMLTSYIGIFLTLALLIELYKPKSQILKFIRTGIVMFQGVWFWVSGIVLDSPIAERWVEEDHANLMFITIAFSWAMCGVVLFQVFYAIIMEKLFGGYDIDGPRSRYLVTRSDGMKQAVNPEPVDDYKPLQQSDAPNDFAASTERA
ncbi:unnamed protein product [Hymenolepis diminuta]|uniref:Transmembrane protein 45B n=1 Tax=Hymenolepis diminuta TaxID=6216 RepID=A0A0R3SES2_HYMDI|nr:unnamed protein product [Hymenolepis diminuta]